MADSRSGNERIIIIIIIIIHRRSQELVLGHSTGFVILFLGVERGGMWGEGVPLPTVEGCPVWVSGPISGIIVE